MKSNAQSTYIGVVSYGALGHVPPSTSNSLIFSGHFRAAQTLTPCGCLSSKIYSFVAVYCMKFCCMNSCFAVVSMPSSLSTRMPTSATSLLTVASSFPKTPGMAAKSYYVIIRQYSISAYYNVVGYCKSPILRNMQCLQSVKCTRIASCFAP